MEKTTEPTFVPQWLNNTGSFNTTSSLHSDEQGSSKSLDKDPLSLSDRTSTSSYFRPTSVTNGSGSLTSYSSFNRNNRSGREYSADSLGNILPSRFGKDALRRSRSSVGKRGELTVVSKSTHVNGAGSLLSGNVKRSFDKDFPSLGADEKQVDSEIGRAPPGLSSAINSLPVGMIGGDGWTSALAEVPVIASNMNGNGSSGQPISVSATASLTGGRNMAETLAHSPPQTQTTPLVTVGTQRLEELAVKQSRQLIPMIPPMPKALGLKIGQSHITNPHTPRSAATVKPDALKTSTVGKLLVLKPSRERNGISPIAKDSLNPTSGSKLPNSPHTVPSVALSSKPGVLVLEKKSSLQAQSRSNFFNLMRKKSVASGCSSFVGAPEIGEPPLVPPGGSGPAVVQQFSKTKVGLTCNGDAGHNQPSSDVIPEEEEARLLRLMGWEESAEVECLTDEEIRSFYQHLLKVKPTSKGAQPKLLMPTSSNSKLDF